MTTKTDGVMIDMRGMSEDQCVAALAQAQIARLTAQRDALREACRKAKDLIDHEDQRATREAREILLAALSGSQPMKWKAECELRPEWAIVLVAVDVRTGQIAYTERPARHNVDDSKRITDAIILGWEDALVEGANQ